MGDSPEPGHPGQVTVKRNPAEPVFEISEDFQRELQGIGSILTLVYLAAFIAPVLTYIVADQWPFPGENVVIGIFAVAALVVLPVVFKSALDLSWLSITRRRPHARLLLATTLAVIPWNPLLLILLPWTIRIYRRVRQADVLLLLRNGPDVQEVIVSDYGEGAFPAKGKQL